MDIYFKIRGIRYQNDDGYFVLHGLYDRYSRRINAKGYIEEFVGINDVKDICLKLYGSFDTDTYGKYFKFTSYEIISNSLVYIFLAKRVSGVGPNLAKRIINTFGDETLNVIQDHPERLIAVNGVSKKRIKVIKQAWSEYYNMKQIVSFLKDYNIPTHIAARVYVTFSDTIEGDIVEYIKTYPYELTTVYGINFQKADYIALELGFAEDDTERIKHAVIQVLKDCVKNKNGDTCITIEQCIQETAKMLDNTNIEVENINAFLREEIYSLDQEQIVVYENHVGLKSYENIERFIANFLYNKAHGLMNIFFNTDVGYVIKKYEEKYGITLNDKQKQAVHKAVSSRVFLLTGYAGTGKTTITHIIATLYKMKFPDTVTGCAVSGIASARLGRMANIPSRTIHSLLEYNGYKFQRDEDNRLDEDVVILDEFGMTDINLFYSLIKAMKKNSVLILIGDSAQLPPIGAGNLLQDIVNMNIAPHIELDEIYRTASDSVINVMADSIRRGKIPQGYNNNHNRKKYKDWVFVEYKRNNVVYLDKKMRIERESEKNNAIAKKVVYTVKQLLATNKVDDFIADWQVLVPIKESVLGAKNLNTEIQKVINNPENLRAEDVLRIQDPVTQKEHYFCKGDKIVHIYNKNMPVADDGDFNNCYMEKVYNGVQGVIVDIIHEYEFVKVKTIDGKYVYYRFIEMGIIAELAYVLTTHKAQGSEFKYVILPVADRYRRMLDNNWLYTAVTRAKHKLIIIGEAKVFEKGILNNKNKHKSTWLNLYNNAGITITEDILNN